MVNAIGQRSRSLGQKTIFEASFNRLPGNIEGQGHMGPGQRSHGSRSKVTRVKVKGHEGQGQLKGQGHQVKNVSFDRLTCIVRGQLGQLGQGKRTHGSRSASRS